MNAAARGADEARPADARRRPARRIDRPPRHRGGSGANPGPSRRGRGRDNRAPARAGPARRERSASRSKSSAERVRPGQADDGRRRRALGGGDSRRYGAADRPRRRESGSRAARPADPCSLFARLRPRRGPPIRYRLRRHGAPVIFGGARAARRLEILRSPARGAFCHYFAQERKPLPRLGALMRAMRPDILQSCRPKRSKTRLPA